jgi:hypothetical protein
VLEETHPQRVIVVTYYAPALYVRSLDGLWELDRERWRSASSLFAPCAVLLVADLFHPPNVLPVNLLLNGDMRHTIGGGRTMPMFHARRYPYDITRLDLLLFTTLLLHPACAGSHDQGLTERMGMPGRAGAGLKRDVRARRA